MFSSETLCPFKWELNYRRALLPAKQGEALTRGSLWHSVMEVHYIYMMTCQQASAKPDAAVLRKMIAPLLYDGRGDQSEMQELVEWMYKGYVEIYPFAQDMHEWKILGVEHAGVFWLPTLTGHRSSFKIRMKLDLIIQERATKHIIVVDHKTCKNLPNDKMLELSVQFGLYTWGLRKMGKKVFGQIHDAARTLKYVDPNKPQPLEERFHRTLMYRTDEQLDQIAKDAYLTARRAWGTKLGEAERAFDDERCRWKCDYLDPCLMSSKGVPLERSMADFGFKVGDPYARYKTEED